LVIFGRFGVAAGDRGGGWGMMAGMKFLLVLVAVVVAVCLWGCAGIDVTGRVYAEDPERGAKGGLVFTPGERPGWWARITGENGGAEISGTVPSAKVRAEK